MNRTTAAILALGVIALVRPALVQAQEQPELVIRALTEAGRVEYSIEKNTFVATNGIMVIYGNAVLTADRARGDQATGEIVAEGRVRIQRDEWVWVGEKIRYNFFTLKMESEQFRTGHAPVFAGGERVGTPVNDGSAAVTNYAGKDTLSILTNQVYTARNAFFTNRRHR
ncbi:MAG: hypothetical protein U1F83_15980 [Verrucomicrobiota bacterium]